MMKRFLALKVSTTSVNQYFVGSFMGVQKSIIAASLSQLITRVVTVWATMLKLKDYGIPPSWPARAFLPFPPCPTFVF